MGVQIAEYVVHYKNGKKSTIPLLYGKNTADWWETTETDYTADTEIAWKGFNAFCASVGVRVQLLKFTWDNPFPDEEIVSIDFRSSMKKAGPFLVALTLEPYEC
jgi:hypothetical protein